MKKVGIVLSVMVLAATMLFSVSAAEKSGDKNENALKKEIGDMLAGKKTCPVLKDTWIYEFRKNKNYGDGGGWTDITDPTHPVTIPKLFLGFGGADKKLALLHFDISGLPSGQAPKKAVVRLYNDYSGSAAATEVAAKQILSAWEEMKVTWNTAPQLAEQGVSTVTLTGAFTDKQPGKWYEWDVTSIVANWQKGQANYGIALDPVGDSGVDRDFVCKEYKAKSNFAPVLVVEF